MLTYAIQKTGYDYERRDPQGVTDFDGFMQAIDTFPWAEQLLEWDKEQDGPLPSVILQNAKAERELWVSVLGRDLGNSFQLNVVWMRPQKGLFGFGKEKKVQEVVTVDVEQRQDVNQLCQLFCDGYYLELGQEVTRLVERMRWREKR